MRSVATIDIGGTVEDLVQTSGMSRISSKDYPHKSIAHLAGRQFPQAKTQIVGRRITAEGRAIYGADKGLVTAPGDAVRRRLHEALQCLTQARGELFFVSIPLA